MRLEKEGNFTGKTSSKNLLVKLCSRVGPDCYCTACASLGTGIEKIQTEDRKTMP